MSDGVSVPDIKTVDMVNDLGVVIGTAPVVSITRLNAPPLQPFVCPWNPDMTKAPRDGSLVLLTEALANEDGVRAVWYIALGTARPWAKAKQGWLDAQLRRWVPFEPAGWALAERG